MKRALTTKELEKAKVAVSALYFANRALLSDTENEALRDEVEQKIITVQVSVEALLLEIDRLRRLNGKAHRRVRWALGMNPAALSAFMHAADRLRVSPTSGVMEAYDKARATIKSIPREGRAK